MGGPQGHEPRGRDEGVRQAGQSPEGPGLTASRPLPTAALLVGAAALVVAVLTTAIPPQNRFLGLLNNAGHAPIFGAFAWIVLRLLERGAAGPGATRYIAAFVITVAAGVAVEGLQSLIGRDASAWDVVMDGAGAAAVLAAVAARRAPQLRQKLLLWLGVLTAATIVLAPLAEAALAYARRAAVFPVLAAFEGPLDLYFLSGSGATLERVPMPRRWAGGVERTVLALRFDATGNPGLRIDEPQPDWRGFRNFKLDLVNPGTRPLRLVLRVHDALHDQRHEDRFNRAFTLEAETRRVIEIPVEDIATAPRDRPLDLERVSGVVLFEASRPAPVGAELLVAGIWLE